MNDTKLALLMRYGYKCMLCSKVTKYVQWHHIRPKYDYKRCGKIPDNSIRNGSLLCPECHSMIHHYDYSDEEYQKMTAIIILHKDQG